MNPIQFPSNYNYCAAFLTLSCQLKCSYCINELHDHYRSELCKSRKAMTAEDWIVGLNRVQAREDLPITLQGGEPTVHPHFYEIINGVDKPMDLLTNVQFDLDEFIDKVPTWKFKRSAPYASIRVSYHPEQMELQDTVKRVLRLASHGYQIGVWMIEHPDWAWHCEEASKEFESVGIDFRFKELLGEVTLKNGEKKAYGTIKYKDSVGEQRENWKSCLCRTSELLIAPDGSIHRCHSDIYALRKGIGHIMDEKFHLDREFRVCHVYGDCSGCDVKVKNNRFQSFGHTSVDIEAVDDPNAMAQIIANC